MDGIPGKCKSKSKGKGESKGKSRSFDSLHYASVAQDDRVVGELRMTELWEGSR